MRARRDPPAAYRLVDHTADIGVVVEGDSLADLFAAAGAAMADLLFDPEKVEEGRALEIALQAPGVEELLVKWLNELLYCREVEGFLWRGLEVELTKQAELRATLRGEVWCPDRHVFRTGLKAATYHQLRVAQEGKGWSARIIFDV